MAEVTAISPEEVKARLESGEELYMIDVREDEEIAEGMIPGAKHIRMGDIPDSLDRLDNDKEYIVICRSGNRSGRVCSFLAEHGYTVVNMEGGMLSWTGETECKK